MARKTQEKTEIEIVAKDGVSDVVAKIEKRVEALSEAVHGFGPSRAGRKLNVSGSGALLGNRAFQGYLNNGLAYAAGIAAPTVLGAVLLETNRHYELASKQLKNHGDLSDEQLERLQEQARELGATTRFSASESVSAMDELATSGYTTNEILAMTPTVLDAATVSMLSMADTAKILGQTLKVYGKDASETNEIANQLVKARTLSQLTLPDYSEALANLGDFAAQQNIPINELASAFGILADKGTRGAEAGTALKMMISRLIKPSKEAADVLNNFGIRPKDILDTNGNLKSLADVFAALAPHAHKTREMLMLFGEEAGPKMAALFGAGEQQFRRMSTAILNHNNILKKSTDELSETLDFKLKELGSSWEELQLQIGDRGFLNVSKVAVGGLTDMLQMLNEADESTKDFAATAAGLGGTAAGVATGLAALGFSAKHLVPYLKHGAQLLGRLGPWGAVAAGGVAAATAGIHYREEIAQILERLEDGARQIVGDDEEEWIDRKLAVKSMSGKAADVIGKGVDLHPFWGPVTRAWKGNDISQIVSDTLEPIKSLLFPEEIEPLMKGVGWPSLDAPIATASLPDRSYPSPKEFEAVQRSDRLHGPSRLKISLQNNLQGGIDVTAESPDLSLEVAQGLMQEGFE